MLSQVNAKAVAWAEARAGELITSVRDTTRDRVRELVAQAIREGWSNATLADSLLGDDVFSGARAEMVARTETAAADVAGNLIGWKESGVVASKEWKVAQDGECDECAALDGEVVGIDEEFPEGDVLRCSRPASEVRTRNCTPSATSCRPPAVTTGARLRVPLPLFQGAPDAE
jgi:hypothetical protein